MADQDELSPPAAKRLCLQDDFPFGSDSLVTDTWDSNEYIGDDFPEAIRDIGSTTGIDDAENDNSNTGLMGFDFPVHSGEHDLHEDDSGPSLQSLSLPNVGDFYLLDEIVDDSVDENSNDENEQENDDGIVDISDDELEERTSAIELEEQERESKDEVCGDFGANVEETSGEGLAEDVEESDEKLVEEIQRSDEEAKEELEEVQKSDEEAKGEVEDIQESDKEAKEEVEDIQESDKEAIEEVDKVQESDKEAKEVEEVQKNDEEVPKNDEEAKEDLKEVQKSDEEAKEEVEEVQKSAEEDVEEMEVQKSDEEEKEIEKMEEVGQVVEDEESQEVVEEEVEITPSSIPKQGTQKDEIVQEDEDRVSEDIQGDLPSEVIDEDDANDTIEENGNGNDDEEDMEEDDFEEEEEEVEEEGDDEQEEEYWDLDSLDSEVELDALLEEDLPDEYKQSRNAEGKQSKRRGMAGAMWRQAVTHEGALPEGLIGVREKTVLRRRGHEPLEGLPDGWIRISHECGMPLYLHRPTRVCTWSRPYLLGSGSARRHHVPTASIPCLHYSRALEAEKRLQNEKDVKEKEDGENRNDKQTETPQTEKESEETSSPSKSAETAEGANAEEVKGQGAVNQEEKSTVKGQRQGKSKIHVCEDESVDGKQLHEYLAKRFEFEKIAIKRFKTWADRRKHNKNLKSKDRPHFPGGPTMIRCQIPGTKKREFVINAQDKTPVCILHEYSQRVMRMQPQYIFQESRNASAPFEAIVEIQGKRYGRGEASSKRMAKAEAARATLDILLPELIAYDKQKTSSDLEYFDHVAIDDGRVYDLCTKAGQLTPWQVLQEYRQRNHGLADTEIKFEVQVRKHQRSQYTLTCGSHTVTGTCKNKNSGKQHGAQKLIKLLHPELTSWGAIIKMYGKGLTEINREKREAEQSIIELQQGKRHKRPNKKILDKLRMEMMKLYGKTEEVVQQMKIQEKEADQKGEDHEEMEEEAPT